VVTRAFVLALITLLAAAPAQARGIQVAPVTLTLTPERGIGALRLRNGRERAAAFEVDVYLWTQQDGRDVLTPAADMLVAPGVFELAPGAEQIVRVGHVGAAPGQERAFRIVVRELPQPARQGGLGFALEMSLPVFVTPRDARPTLDARVEHGERAPVLRLANLGAAHAQLSGVEVDAGGQVRAPRYLLAGARFDIALPARAGAVRIAVMDGQDAPREHAIDVRPQAVAAAVP
jgi:fimbrial chaperone protein